MEPAGRSPALQSTDGSRRVSTPGGTLSSDKQQFSFCSSLFVATRAYGESNGQVTRRERVS
jgi:hypothetical protein